MSGPPKHPAPPPLEDVAARVTALIDRGLRRYGKGDLDGALGPDLIVGNPAGGAVTVLLNQGDATFVRSGSYQAGTQPTSLAVADLDGINGPDVAVANFSSDDVSVLLNQCPLPCTADVNFDAQVSIVDLLFILAHWGPCRDKPCTGDFDGDGTIGPLDLQVVLETWGDCP